MDSLKRTCRFQNLIAILLSLGMTSAINGGVSSLA